MTERPQTPAAPDPDPIEVAREWMPRFPPPVQGMLGRLIAALEEARRLLSIAGEALELAVELAHQRLMLCPPSARRGERLVEVVPEVGDDEPGYCTVCGQLNETELEPPFVADPDNLCVHGPDPLDRLVDEAAARRAG